MGKGKLDGHVLVRAGVRACVLGVLTATGLMGWLLIKTASVKAITSHNLGKVAGYFVLIAVVSGAALFGLMVVSAHSPGFLKGPLVFSLPIPGCLTVLLVGGVATGAGTTDVGGRLAFVWLVIWIPLFGLAMLHKLAWRIGKAASKGVADRLGPPPDNA